MTTVKTKRRYVNRSEAIEMLKRTAEQHPDFVFRDVYRTCFYAASNLDEKRHAGVKADDDTPERCIVGQMLATQLDVPDTLLCQMSSSISIESDGRLMDHGIHLSVDAVKVLQNAQGWQDEYGVTWLEAVKLAEHAITPLELDAAEAFLGRTIPHDPPITAPVTED